MANLAFAVAVLAAALCQSAVAASSTAATLGPLTIQLIDLDPLDGVTPTISFVGGDSEAWARALDTSKSSVSELRYGTGGWGPVSASATYLVNQAGASVSGDGTPAGSTVSAVGRTAGTVFTGDWPHYGQFYSLAHAPHYASFTLSTHTQAVFQVSYAASTAVTASFDPALAQDYEGAGAQLELTAYGPGPNGDGSQSTTGRKSIFSESTEVADPSCVYGVCYTGSSSNASGTLAASFVNASGSDLTGTLYAFAYATGYSLVNAVPEPSMLAMLMVGLGVIGFLAPLRQR